MTPAEQRLTDQRILGQRLRRRRLEAGLTAKQAAQPAGFSHTVWQVWEVGARPYSVKRLAAIAAALGVPIASLVVDDLVLAEIRLSPETLERIRREGRPAAIAAVERISDNLVALALAEASRPAIDLSPGARPRPRRSREQLLTEREAGIARNRARVAASAEQRRRARQVVEAESP